MTSAAMPSKCKLVLISGVSGAMGRTYYKYFVRLKGVVCFGIARRPSSDSRHVALDLLDKEKAEAFVQLLPIEGVSEILYMHLIGMAKFEPDGKPEIDHDGDGIDDEVYSSNVLTLKNIVSPLVKRAEELKIPISIVNICSISDVYIVPLWQSYSRSKNIVRQYMKSQPAFVRNIIINISSLKADLEKYGRPFADTSYWLNPRELLERSLPVIEIRLPVRTIEVDIFNPDPNYGPEYFTNIPLLLEKWRRDMGCPKGLIPLGIRI